MQIIRTNVNVGGDACDVHARLDGHGALAWCAVYVRPVQPVNGYWYEPSLSGAVAILTSLDVIL